MTVHSAWLLTNGQTAEDTRLTQLGATLPADPLTVRSGILPGSATGSAIVAAFGLTSQSGMSATVGPGRAVIQGTAAQGAYPVTLSDATPVTIADNTSQYARIDLVCLRVYDASYAGEQTTADLEVIQGTPSAVPVVPAIPELTLPLYEVRVPAGASAGGGGVDWTTQVLDLRATTVATGGVLPAYGNTTVPGAYPGQYRGLGNVLQRWDGTAWVPYPQAVGGIAPSDTFAGAYTGQYRDTFESRLQRWDGTTWQELVPGFSLNGAIAGGGTTSTAYVSTLTGATTPITADFTAPASGRVLVRVTGRVVSSSATASGYLTVAVTQGSTTFQAASDDLAAVGSGAYPHSVATEFQLGGMTPGLVYTATLFYRSSIASATATFANRVVHVEPGR
ncbi:hypothetical protein [Actinacidiphila yeochonensis]|uniref:hypothetical protein n=1 Tax=Actinacidiphila yeochonensis TaxID=89050 RepID=UPI000563C39E|nr:hypothetical protein [Actinacidiphila yeochonensis]